MHTAGIEPDLRSEGPATNRLSLAGPSVGSVSVTGVVLPNLYAQPFCVFL
jgi:hypothetical protein